LAVTTSDDDGFREIQLNGKQLVFLFMAVTVVLVVTFLTGVLVGRGVRAERAEAAQADVLSDAPPTPPRQPDASASAGDDPRQATPPEAGSEESAEPPVAAPRNPEPAPKAAGPEPRAVEPAKAPTAAANVSNSTKPPAPAVKPPAAAPAAAPASSAKNTPAATAKATSGTPATDTSSAVPVAPPSGPKNGYAVQVAAVNVRRDADDIVRRLSAKGYSAYVEVPRNNASMFRVRVGTFRTRREAQNMAERLQKEEKFKPWVTR
jgi:cell division septation protein DedD